MLNITTFLDANMRRLSKNIFFCPESGKSYNSKEVLSIASAIAEKLKESGTKKGDRILIYLKNSPEYLFSYFAIWRIGAVAVPTNRIYTKFELDHIIENSQASLIITDQEGAKLFKKKAASDSNSGSASDSNSGSASDSNSCSASAFDSVSIYVPTDIEKMRTHPILPPAFTMPDDLCHIQYTSGTTGKPKGAMLTHGNWLAALSNECDVMEYTEKDVYLGIYPMGHVGLSWGFAALYAGALYIMMERFDLEKYLDLIEKNKVTALSGMPPVIHSLVGCPDGTEKRLKTVREIISGGGTLHHEIWKTFHHRYHIPVVNAYGLSETIVIGTGTVIRPIDYETADKFQSVGHPVCFSEVKIVDENDPSVELKTGENGEIALRGPAVAKGYFGMPEETKKSFLEDGWFLTGDIGYLDKDERLCITDRKKDMIVMSGWKIYPTEVEEVLFKHPGVQDVAVFGINHPHRGEISIAAVIWKNGIENPKELEAFAKEHLAGYKVPRQFITVSELPRVNGWKLLRRELKEKYEAEFGEGK
jgi:long-chain acyl-CoA synthetase